MGIASFLFDIFNDVCYTIGMATIKLHGKHGIGWSTTVDDDVYDHLSTYTWNRTYNGYAHGSIDGKAVALHRFIVGLDNIPKGKHVDHINRDRLDNRRENLRIVSPEQNTLNSNGPFNPDYTPTAEERERWRIKGIQTRAYRRKLKQNRELKRKHKQDPSPEQIPTPVSEPEPEPESDRVSATKPDRKPAPNLPTYIPWLGFED